MKEKQEEQNKKKEEKEIKEEKIPTKINTEIFESNKLKKQKMLLIKLLLLK